MWANAVGNVAVCGDTETRLAPEDDLLDEIAVLVPAGRLSAEIVGTFDFRTVDDVSRAFASVGFFRFDAIAMLSYGARSPTCFHRSIYLSRSPFPLS